MDVPWPRNSSAGICPREILTHMCKHTCTYTHSHTHSEALEVKLGSLGLRTIKKKKSQTVLKMKSYMAVWTNEEDLYVHTKLVTSAEGLPFWFSVLLYYFPGSPVVKTLSSHYRELPCCWFFYTKHNFYNAFSFNNFFNYCFVWFCLLCWVIFAPWAFFNCIKLGLLFIAMNSLLVAVASLVESRL